MGIFFLNSTEEEKREREKEKEEELKRIAEETLQLVKDAPNDLFPEFIWKVQINEFETDNDYRTKAACTNPAVLRAYSIGRKYSQYVDYLDAMEAYVEYARYIDTIYGSFEMMERANQEGYSSIYIPPKPKLSHKKKNKIFIETGFVPSRIDTDYTVPEGVIESQIASIPPAELSFEDADIPDQIKKIREAMLGSKAKSDRVAGIFKYNSDHKHVQGMDAIVSFLTGSTNQTADRQTESSLSDQIDALHEFDGIPPEIVEAILMPQERTFIRDGYIQTQRERDVQEIIRTMEMNGFNILGSTITSGMKTSAVRALRREFGVEEDLSKMSKKQRKKYKKKMAQLEADKRNAIAGDRRIQRTLLSNRIHMSRDTADDFGVNSSLVDFRLSDIFGDGND